MENNNEKEFVICFGCGEEIRIEDSNEFEGEDFCDDCFEEYQICRICGHLHTQDSMHHDTYHDDYVCDGCYDQYCLSTCEDCGDITEDCVGVDGGDYVVCTDCADRNYYRCDDCGNYFSSGEINSDSNGTVICNECYEYSYTRCEDCEEIIHNDDAYYDDNGYYCYCESCNSNHSTAIHSYSYKPSPIFHSMDGVSSREEENTLYLGVELEIDNGRNKEEMVRDIHEDMEWIYCKEDSSLDNGIELVTHPCTLDFHLNNGYSDKFKELISNGWRGHDTTTCGLHCHINRGYLGNTENEQELTIAKIMLVMDRLWDNGLVKFTRRTIGQLERWAKRCYMEENGEDFHDFTEEKIIEKATSYKSQGRYYALNLRNSNTIEFRLFRSSLNLVTFYATLQFVSNLVEFCKHTSLIQLQTTDVRMSTIVNYKEYKELTAYATKRKLI